MVVSGSCMVVWAKQKMERDDLPIPEEFLCPITHELMIDPVLTLDGQTYEREAISNWFQRRTTSVSSPITGAILSSNLLIPNYALRNAINKFNTHLPFLTEALNEINEIRRKLNDKENEIREHIKHGLAIVSVINTSDLVNKFQSTMQSLAQVSPFSEETNSNSQKETKAVMGGERGCDEESEDQGKERLKSDNCEAKQMDQFFKQVCFTTPQEYESYDASLINSLILHQQTDLEKQFQSLQEELKHCEMRQGEVVEEIKFYEKESLRIENLISDLKRRVQTHEQEIEALRSRQTTHQTKLDELCLKYCEMAHALMGQSEEASKSALESLKISPPTEKPKSPILQDYLKVVVLMNEVESAIHSHLQRIEEFGIVGLKEQFRNVMLKLDELSSTRTQLKGLKQSLDEQYVLCSDQLKQLTDVREDLSDSIQWARRQTIGLYQVNLLTIPVILLLFKQYCRLELISGKDIDALAKEKITPSRMKRWNCSMSEVSKAGFDLQALKEAGYNPRDNRPSRIG
jgi:chromosome segregation ATPase